jgi:Domain of unknown function (DUF4381)
MMQQDPLAALNPLREPEAITWWPLSPGWWLLALVVLFAITFLLYTLYRRYQARRYRRLGAAQLRRLHDSYSQHGNTYEFITAGNALLKSVALEAYPAAKIAACHGNKWVEFLNIGMPENKRFDPAFAVSIYEKNPDSIDSDAFHEAANHWIRHHRSDSTKTEAGQVRK